MKLRVAVSAALKRLAASRFSPNAFGDSPFVLTEAVPCNTLERQYLKIRTRE